MLPVWLGVGVVVWNALAGHEVPEDVCTFCKCVVFDPGDVSRRT